MKITLREYAKGEGHYTDYTYEAEAMPSAGDIIIGDHGDEWHVQGNVTVWAKSGGIHRQPIVKARHYAQDELEGEE